MNTIASARNVSVTLSAKETNALLQEVPRAYKTQINDVLLTALAQAFAGWTGENTLLIDMEGHGREEIVEGVDLSRTVGWFTTIFPVLLQLDPDCYPGGCAQVGKGAVAPHPQAGHWLWCVALSEARRQRITKKLRALPQAEVCFNYLGQVDQVGVWTSVFQVQSGKRADQTGACREVGVICWKSTAVWLDGQLQLDWTYSKHLHRRDTIERLAQGFIEALRTLIMHCQSPDAGGYTPSDFPKMKLSQQELDELMTALGESAEGD